MWMLENDVCRMGFRQCDCYFIFQRMDEKEHTVVPCEFLDFLDFFFCFCAVYR